MDDTRIDNMDKSLPPQIKESLQGRRSRVGLTQVSFREYIIYMENAFKKGRVNRKWFILHFENGCCTPAPSKEKKRVTLSSILSAAAPSTVTALAAP